MAASGSVWLAFEKSDPNGPYDRLYIDANANGDLSDDAASEPYRRESNMASFGPLKIVFNTEDGPITYHLAAELGISPGQKYCVLSPACWYEGSITVGGVKKQCVLIDYNINGAFNDKSIDPGQCDRIRIGEEGGRDTRYVGNFIEIGDKLYKPEIARDGACITLTEATDVVLRRRPHRGEYRVLRRRRRQRPVPPHARERDCQASRRRVPREALEHGPKR